MTHRYGNYVVQRLMEHSRGGERERIYRTLISLPIDFKSHQHGMHIMNALQKVPNGVASSDAPGFQRVQSRQQLGNGLRLLAALAAWSRCLNALCSPSEVSGVRVYRDGSGLKEARPEENPAGIALESLDIFKKKISKRQKS